MPNLLDLYCCAGGAGTGYFRAGFDVYGVDVVPQPHYPFPFHRGDALDVLDTLAAGGGVDFIGARGITRLTLDDVDVIHASPPCQRYTALRYIADAVPAADDQLDIVERYVPPRTRPDLLPPTRDALDVLGVPYVIENVVGAPMRADVTLCGSEFDRVAVDDDGQLLQLRRHRQFEANVTLHGAGGCNHRPGVRTASVFGHGGPMDHTSADRGGYVPADAVCAALLGVTWPMTKRELSEAIPPAYTEFLGRQILTVLDEPAQTHTPNVPQRGDTAPNGGHETMAPIVAFLGS
jgi:DNA (cytosine-5)-methyltransferase 1